jgi:uncharacterized protein YlxW (UPF0749 family)
MSGSRDSGERDAIDFERKTKELEESRRRKVELEEILRKTEIEINDLQQKGEDYEDKRVKILIQK